MTIQEFEAISEAIANDAERKRTRSLSIWQAYPPQVEHLSARHDVSAWVHLSIASVRSALTVNADENGCSRCYLLLEELEAQELELEVTR